MLIISDHRHAQAGMGDKSNQGWAEAAAAEQMDENAVAS